MVPRQIYSFGGFTLDAGARVLSWRGKPVRLGRKPTEILLVLVANHGRVVTKELFAPVWRDRVAAAGGS